MSRSVGLIYKHTCLVAESTNGIYIGKTLAKNPKNRWQNGKGYIRVDETGKPKNTKMINTILKFGIENWNNPLIWKHEIIEENISKENLADREIYWINYYDSFNLGLNSTAGGDGSSGRVYSEKSIAKMIKTGSVRAKKLYEYDANYILVNSYDSIGSAIRLLNISPKSALKNCINKPGRHLYGHLFMTTLLTQEELAKLVNTHEKNIREKRSIASKKSNKKRCATILANKFNAGYTEKMRKKNIVYVKNILTNETKVFDSKRKCLIAFHISKETLAKYINSGEIYKNCLFNLEIKDVSYKQRKLIKPE